MEQRWTPTSDRLPEKGQLVDWIAPGGEQVDGGKYGGGAVWFLPGDNPMYVYYRPTYWRPAQAQPHGGAS